MAAPNGSDADEGLRQEVTAICARLDGGDGASLGEVTGRLAALSSRHAPARLARALDGSALVDLQAKLAPAYADDIRRREIAAVQQWLAAPSAGLDGAGEFARHTYARVADMFDCVDFHACARFVMVGCGPLPATIWHVHTRTGVPSLLGLDVDPAAAAWGRRLLGAIDGGRAQVECQAGERADFGDADVVYVANLISRKAEVLERIAETARPGTQVVLRDPVLVGRLWAESGADLLRRRFRVTGEGPGDLRFYSKHLFATVT